MTKVLIIDNYDSFTYNLVHYLESLDCKVTVFRNDEFELNELNDFNKILLSPGPGLPSESGLLLDVIKTFYSTKSILGICLGMQAIGEVFGGTLVNLDKVYHGVATKTIQTNEDTLFKDIPKEFFVGRYHSWAISSQNFPDVLEITSVDERDEIMSIRHKTFDVKGVQFHPESILTNHGKVILQNWLNN